MLSNNVSSKKELTAQFLWRSSVWPLPPIHLLGSWRAPPWLRIAAAVTTLYSGGAPREISQSTTNRCHDRNDQQKITTNTEYYYNYY